MNSSSTALKLLPRFCFLLSAGLGSCAFGVAGGVGTDACEADDCVDDDGDWHGALPAGSFCDCSVSLL